MTVALYAYTCGFLTLPRSILLDGAPGVATVPVPAYLIVHPRGRALFDSGLNVDCREDPVGYIGEAASKVIQFHFLPGEEVSARLAASGFAADQVDFVINSHLHYDHSGGNALIPNADIVVQAREWAHAKAVADQNLGYLARDFDTGQRLRQLQGEHDLFGDGSVVCIPTYGHTPGHQSVRLKTELGGEIVLCGDACYLKESLETLTTPSVAHDREAMIEVFHRLRRMQALGATLMYGHDPDFWAGVPQAPRRLG
ncbi:MAG: N-acyl homoserine lactonase family protein [Alphaproteobacteria bacterium]|nr:N-acyl homoserine lactonase family protein [Alphaproteobacteria bacterium]